MIAKLRGTVDQVGEGCVVIDVNGVGYMVFCCSRTLHELSVRHSDISLLIDTHVREDHIHLYGFSTALEREWSRMLQSVQGVGAKLALSILSVLDSSQLAQALAVQDKTPFTQVSGVGSRLAQRIASELKDKVPSSIEVFSAEKLNGSEEGKTREIISDAISALVNLGYGQAEAYRVISVASKDVDLSLEALVRKGLKELSHLGDAR